MTEGGSAEACSAVEHGEQRLSRSKSGGFRLATVGGPGVEVTSAKDGWKVAIEGREQRWVLGRAHTDTGGFVLRTEELRTEVGRTTRLAGVGSGADLYYVLLGDGRLFRIGALGPRESGFELVGWEAPGAYLIARPEAGGWRVSPTPACGGLPDVCALSILFAAEILESEEPLT